MGYDGDENIETTACGVEVERVSPKSNISYFASYQGSLEVEADEDEMWRKNSMAFGIRYSFGNRATPQNPNQGANLSDFNPFTGARHVRYPDYE